MHGYLRQLGCVVSLGSSLFTAVFILGNGNSVASAPKARGPQAEDGWRLGPPVTYQNLTIFPVVSAIDADTNGFATLDDALASGAATVTEEGNYMRRSRDVRVAPQFSDAQVNRLVLVNRGKKPLLLLAGEVVSGGKQDRIIGKDRIVPVGAEPLPLDVFCVEHGRWTDGGDEFAAAKMIVHPSVREKAAVEWPAHPPPQRREFLPIRLRRRSRRVRQRNRTERSTNPRPWARRSKASRKKLTGDSGARRAN